MNPPLRKFQYFINKKARNILDWLEKEMYEIPSINYKGTRIHYYTELNGDAIEVHYKAYDIQTGEYRGGDIQFSFIVDEFDSSSSVITGKFYNARDIDLEKLAYTYLLNLGTMVNAEWKTEVLQHLELIQPSELPAEAAKPEKPQQKGRYRLTPKQIKDRKKIVKEAKKRKQENPRITWKEISHDMDIPERTLRDYRHNY